MLNKIALLTLLSFTLFSGNSVFAEEVVQIQFKALPDAVKKTVSDFVKKKVLAK